jgi:general secretion pathway protein D
MASTLLFASVFAAGLFFGPAMDETPPVPQKAHGMISRVYNVADLVIPISQAPVMVLGDEANSKDAETPKETAPSSRVKLEEVLMQLILTTVDPPCWSENGGKGTLNYYPLGMALVVNQTPDIQEQVADLLEALRRLQDVEVSVEIRLVTVSQAFFEARTPCEGGTNAKSRGIAKLKGLTFLDAKQLQQFMESAQEDRATVTMGTPRITVFDGQRATVSVSDELSYLTACKVVQVKDQAVVVPESQRLTAGFFLQVQPVVSADRRRVSMNIAGKLIEVDPVVDVVPVTTHLVSKDKKGKERMVPVQQLVQQPTVRTMTIRKSFEVADGKTVLMYWGTRMETKSEEGTAEPRVVLLLITPRVVINERDE